MATPKNSAKPLGYENTPHNGVYLTYAYAPALSGKQGSVLSGVLAYSIRFAESDSLKSVCCMIYLIKNLNIYKNLCLWNSILFFGSAERQLTKNFGRTMVGLDNLTRFL